MASKEMNENILLLKEMNSKLRYIFSIYSISKDGFIYGVNKGEEEGNNSVHSDKFAFVHTSNILSLGELAISSASLFELLKSFKKTKSSASFTNKISIYDNDDILVGEINYLNENFIENTKERYSILNDVYAEKIIKLTDDDFYKLNETEMSQLCSNQLLNIPLNETASIYFDKDMCTDTVRESSNIFVRCVSDIFNYNKPNKDLVCLREDINLEKKKETIRLCSIYTIMAIQKHV